MSKSKYPIIYRLEMPQGYYCEARIYANRPQMYKAQKRLHREEGATNLRKHNYEAIACTTPPMVNEKQFGVILFHKGSARKGGIVSHEIAHMATFWQQFMGRTKDIFSKANNEKFCWIIGEMVHDYWLQWWEDNE